MMFLMVAILLQERLHRQIMLWSIDREIIRMIHVTTLLLPREVSLY